MEKKRWRCKNYIILFAAVTLIFLALYHNVIWGNSTNMFTDIGCDTLFMAYPNQYIRNTMPQGGYALNYGFGAYIPGKWYTMLQPFNWVQLFISDIVTANMVSLYLQHLVTALFGYLFFRKLMKTDSVTPLICAIIWAYSGYAVLWSQHGWTINLAFFSMMMYFLQCMLYGEKKGYFVVIPFAIMAIHSYYFFYMDGIFAALYIVGYAVVNKMPWKKCLKDIAKLACVGVAAAGIGAVGLLPGLRSYFVSARTSVASQKTAGIFQNTSYLFCTLGRFFSNDIFGKGNAYTGYYNYYEAAVLACTALTIPCIVILLHNRKYVKQIVTLAVLGVAALCLQVASFVLTLDSRKPRWTYMLIFVMAIGVGYCVERILQGDVRVSKSDFFVTGAIYAVLFAILWTGDRYGIADVKRTPCIVAVLFTGGYLLLLLLMSKQVCVKQVMIALFAIAMAEMVVNNYAAVNKRDIVTKDALQNSLYQDGTQELLSEIKEDEIFRTNKTYLSVFLNDSMVQGYNGLGIYNSVNSQELIDYFQSFGFELMNGMTHYIYIGSDQTTLNTLLGVKYVVVKEGDAVPEGYHLVSEKGDKQLYINDQALGFGYIYADGMEKNQFEQLSMQDKIKSLTKYYYLTEDADDEKARQDVDVTVIDEKDSLEQLAENSAYGTSLEGDTLTLTIDKTEKSQMLCIPVIYDTNWKVYIDGCLQDGRNINGGLLGIDVTELAEGSHQVAMRYDAKEYDCGGKISIIAFSIYLCVGILLLLCQKMQVKSKVLTYLS